jgi:hypothetical protein
LTKGGVVLDMVFAHFMATGSEAAFRRILAALAGHFAAGDPAAASSAEKAKVTLSSRVGDDPRLLEVVHREADAREEPLAELLRGVLVAAAAQARGRPSGN